MGKNRQLLFEKIRAYQENYELCKEKAYTHPLYQQQFELAEDLTRFITDGFESGLLDAKDIFDADLELKNLFKMTQNIALREKALDMLKEINAAIKEMFHGK